jgi:3-hydroxyacyl-[acyl-carrier-protein] dehydratase
VTAPAPGELLITDMPAFAAPLRAVDQVSVDRSDGTMRIVATKAVLATDPYMSGHFPGFTIFPGVFLIEALRQAVAAAFGAGTEPAAPASRRPEIIELRSVRFLAPLLPGDVFTIDARVASKQDDGRFDVEARCFRADGVTAATLKLRFGIGGPGNA